MKAEAMGKLTFCVQQAPRHPVCFQSIFGQQQTPPARQNNEQAG
jgi:hypothetical protein